MYADVHQQQHTAHRLHCTQSVLRRKTVMVPCSCEIMTSTHNGGKHSLGTVSRLVQDWLPE